jgi:hypothetical protein
MSGACRYPGPSYGQALGHQVKNDLCAGRRLSAYPHFHAVWCPMWGMEQGNRAM